MSRPPSLAFVPLWPLTIVLLIGTAIITGLTWNMPDTQELGIRINPWFIPLYLVVLFLAILTNKHRRKISWLQALSFYSVDVNTDERERHILYQATAVAFSVTMMVILAATVTVRLSLPTSPDAVVNLVMTIGLLAVTIQNAVAWWLWRH